MACSTVPLMALFLLMGLSSRAFAVEFNNLADVSCGQKSSTQREARIVGGQDAIPQEFPWLVSITRIGSHICGGTIVSSKFILTAAHCLCGRDGIIPVNQFQVTVGEHDLQKPELPDAISIRVKRMIVHPNSKCGTYKNDVALLELITDISWTESVRPACLPLESGRSGYSVFGGKNAVAAGWGWLGEDKTMNHKSNVLQKVGVNVLEDQVCNEWYASQGKVYRVKYGQMCAGHENGGQDTCAADSGGPLMYSNGNTETIVIGIVSTGVGCARKRLPGIYTRVSEFVPWIIENTQK